MPELSVIVHGPNTQDRLTGLLASLAAHPHPDVEVIVAAVGPWAQETAGAYAPEMLVLPLPDGTDDAAARSAGAARASGRWLHFVHAKDGLPVGGPRMVAERAAELPDEVDVLLFDHVRSTWETSGLPSTDGPRLARAGRAAHSLDDIARSALRITPLLGNRALRTSFWQAHESRLTSPDEPYAAYAALLRADRIAALNQVAYEHHELRPESLPPVTPEKHYALVDRYEALLALARTRADSHAAAATATPTATAESAGPAEAADPAGLAQTPLDPTDRPTPPGLTSPVRRPVSPTSTASTASTAGTVPRTARHRLAPLAPKAPPAPQPAPSTPSSTTSWSATACAPSPATAMPDPVAREFFRRAADAALAPAPARVPPPRRPRGHPPSASRRERLHQVPRLPGRQPHPPRREVGRANPQAPGRRRARRPPLPQVPVPPGRPQPGRLRGVLEPRSRLQPGSHRRRAHRTRPADPPGVGGDPRERPPPAAPHRPRAPRHPPLLRGAGHAPSTWSTTSTSPTRW